MSDAAEVGSPVANITGEKVVLGPAGRDLVPLFDRWFNDFEVTRNLHTPLFPTAVERNRARYDAIAADPAAVTFVIYDRTTMRPIGRTRLHTIHREHRTAEFAIMIGEKAFHSRGYGTEVARLMLDYGFNALGLHNIWLWTASFNLAGIKAYERAGFREVGRRRGAYALGGAQYDFVCMDCLASEFTASSAISDAANRVSPG